MDPEKKVIDILTEICGAEPGEITPELRLFDEGLLDSFGTIQLVMALEDTFGVALAIEELSREKLATPAQIAALIEEASR